MRKPLKKKQLRPSGHANRYVTMRMLFDLLYVHSRDCTRIMNEKLTLDNEDLKKKTKLYHEIVIDALRKLRDDLMNLRRRTDALEKKGLLP